MGFGISQISQVGNSGLGEEQELGWALAIYCPVADHCDLG